MKTHNFIDAYIEDQREKTKNLFVLCSLSLPAFLGVLFTILDSL